MIAHTGPDEDRFAWWLSVCLFVYAFAFSVDIVDESPIFLY